ncbi:MAG: helix-turn-helix transcriptional regulator [Caulobacteraceae bacterium]
MPKTIFQGDHQHLVTVLTEARHRAELTQVELARVIGRDQSFVSLFESGQRRIDVIEFFKLARALNRDPQELFAEVAERIGKDIDPIIP